MRGRKEKTGEPVIAIGSPLITKTWDAPIYIYCYMYRMLTMWLRDKYNLLTCQPVYWLESLVRRVDPGEDRINMVYEAQ